MVMVPTGALWVGWGSRVGLVGCCGAMVARVG